MSNQLARLVSPHLPTCIISPLASIKDQGVNSLVIQLAYVRLGLFRAAYAPFWTAFHGWAVLKELDQVGSWSELLVNSCSLAALRQRINPMKHHQLPFDKLLEHYVFRVTLEIIDLVDSKTQTRLIRLFTRINKEPSPGAKQSVADVKTSKRLIALHQITIDTILSSISKVDTLIAKAQKAYPLSAQTKALMTRYVALKNRYLVALVKVQVLQQSHINRLE